jgi:hypothetical protein
MPFARLVEKPVDDFELLGSTDYHQPILVPNSLESKGFGPAATTA